MSDIYTHTHTQYMYISIPNMYENNLTFFGINFEGNMGQSPFFWLYIQAIWIQYL